MELSIKHQLVLLLLFLLTPLSHCDSKLTGICKDTNTHTESTSLGKTVELPCFILISGETAVTYRAKWMKYPPASSKPELILAWPKESQVSNSEGYSGARVNLRWGVEGATIGNLSLSLRGVRKNDSGLYVCTVWKGWNCIMSRTVILKVKECHDLPSVTATTGTTATLPCPFETVPGKKHAPKISWKRVQGEQDERIIQYPPNDSPRHNRAKFKVNFKSGDVSLQILFVTQNDTNWYRCELQVGENQSCYEMRLQVKDSVIKTVGQANVTVNKTANEKHRESTVQTSRSKVAIVSPIVVMAAVMAVTACVVYIKCRKKTNQGEDNSEHIYYETIHQEDCGYVTNSLYTKALYSFQKD